MSHVVIKVLQVLTFHLKKHCKSFVFFTEFLFESIFICLIYQLYSFERFRPSVTDRIGI